MEKIYMESENKRQRKQSFFKRLFNDRGSMSALIVLAVVGVIGLMVFGLNQISYATDQTQQLPESFVSAQGDDSVRLIGETKEGVAGVLPIYGFYTDGGIPIFCIEYNNSYVLDEEYAPNEEITDYGLIYLMSKIYPNVPFKDAAGTELAENVQIWLTQSAIWSYLYETGDTNNSKFGVDASGNGDGWNDKVKAVDKLYDSTYSQTGEYVITADSGMTLFEQYGINILIAQAKNVGDVALNVSKASENISVTKDNKYYQSDLITVTIENSLPIISEYGGYAVNLVNAPEGTVLVDASGNVYDDITNMPASAQFYVRVPVDKVNDTNKNLKISINGKFRMWGANKYVSRVSSTHQKVANVKILNRQISVPLDIQLDYTPDVPNTGMGVAQTIYFIGLILLLSGVGIVYANAKPKESE